MSSSTIPNSDSSCQCESREGRILRNGILAALLGIFSLPTVAQDSAEPTPDSLRTHTIQEVTILGQHDGIFRQTPGSVSFLSSKEVKLIAPISGNEVFRKVPGVQVVDEEGVGLRMNLGIRGLDPDRSRSVLVLEDGIPVALNPYGEPELYYTPTIDRMSGVEVMKGSGQIMYGPQTIGGVVNYITPDAPEVSSGFIKLRGGQGGYFSGLAGWGTTFGTTGVQVNFLRKQGDNVGYANFRINDLSSKLNLQLSERSRLMLKLGVYDETSNATYVGLTQTMYDAGGQDFTLMAPDDRLEVRRYSLSAIHTHTFSDAVKLRTTAFGYTTTRNWQRQDFSSSMPANWTGVTWGDTEVPGGAVYMRNSTGDRNRQFEVAGIEPRVQVNYNFAGIENQLDAGTRFMYERAFEQRVNGTKFNARSGSLVEDEVRTGYALSAYAQNRFELSQKFNVTGGVRVEKFDYERHILRNSFNINGKNAVRDTSIVSGSDLVKVIPGIGANYSVSTHTSVFAGVHRGFAPPRVKDAITKVGEAMNLDAELSWNSELGFRTSTPQGINLELTGFLMDFSNQIIPVSESSGGTGSGLVNGGRTRHAGVEAAFGIDFGQLLHSEYKYRLESNATYVEATYNADRFVSQDGERVNIRGNRTPYAPKWLLNNAFTVEAPFGLALRLSSTYTGEQYADELNTEAPSADGRNGKLAAFWLFDATAIYRVPKTMLSFHAAVKNLTDERYIVSRRPQGIRVGLHRFATAGVDFNF
jgi:Fe(3+) dicitrate transport protein